MNKDQFFGFLESTFGSCLETSKRKNADYAGDSDPFANFRIVEKLGICSTETGILVRITDKLARIVNLIDGRENQVKDEAVDDTILDAINYFAILAAYRESKRNEQRD